MLTHTQFPLLWSQRPSCEQRTWSNSVIPLNHFCPWLESPPSRQSAERRVEASGPQLEVNPYSRVESTSSLRFFFKANFSLCLALDPAAPSLKCERWFKTAPWVSTLSARNEEDERHLEHEMNSTRCRHACAYIYQQKTPKTWSRAVCFQNS